ncbi:MAG: glycosyltransferase family 2 protein [Pirellulales bacterium]|nr:glycosyltransferase family 2 protein [Pirellulales bacterium]
MTNIMHGETPPHQSESPTEKSHPTTLSVVIIGLNEAGRIVNCIESIKCAVKELPDTELVYIDSGSTDDTVRLALEHGASVYRLGRTQLPSPSAGRYVGSLVTTGRYIMFVDGDSTVCPGWINEAINVLACDDTVVMVCGQFVDSNEWIPDEPLNTKGLGKLTQVKHISGSWSPIVSREAMEKAGNWNPFVRCREEADLEVRMLHFVPNAKMLKGNQRTVLTPKASTLTFSEITRRCRIGFVKGMGQILRNAIADGYLVKCLPIVKPIFLASGLLLGLAISIALGWWWQFLLAFLGIVVLRALLTWKLARLRSATYSLLLGFSCLWEFIRVPVRRASDYVRDFEKIDA